MNRRTLITLFLALVSGCSRHNSKRAYINLLLTPNNTPRESKYVEFDDSGIPKEPIEIKIHGDCQIDGVFITDNDSPNSKIYAFYIVNRAAKANDIVKLSDIKIDFQKAQYGTAKIK